MSIKNQLKSYIKKLIGDDQIGISYFYTCDNIKKHFNENQKINGWLDEQGIEFCKLMGLGYKRSFVVHLLMRDYPSVKWDLLPEDQRHEAYKKYRIKWLKHLLTELENM